MASVVTGSLNIGGDPPILDFDLYDRIGFEVWEERWNTWKHFCKMEAENVYFHLVRSFTDKTLRTFKGLKLSGPDARNPDLIIKRLSELIRDGKGKYFYRMEFVKRIQGPEECFDAWFSDLKDFSLKCDFERDCCEDCRNSRLLDQILVGINNKSIRKKILAMGSTLSLDQAVTVIREFETKENPQVKRLVPDSNLDKINIKTELPTPSNVTRPSHEAKKEFPASSLSGPMLSSTPAKNLQSWSSLPVSSMSKNNSTTTNAQALNPARNILSRKNFSVSNCLENLSKNRSISVQSVNKTPNVESREKVNISSHFNSELIRNNPHNAHPELQVKSDNLPDRRRTNSSGSHVHPEKRSRVSEDLNDSIEIIDEVDTEQPIFTCQDCKECFSKQIAINKHVCKKPENNQQKSIPDKESAKVVGQARPLVSEKTNKVLEVSEMFSLSSDEDDEFDREDQKANQHLNVEGKQLIMINDVQSLANPSAGPVKPKRGRKKGFKLNRDVIINWMQSKAAKPMKRSRISNVQLEAIKMEHDISSDLSGTRKAEIAARLNLDPDKVRLWFWKLTKMQK